MKWGIRSITFSGGEEIQLDYGSTLVILGPNSGGKSTALREIVNMFNNYHIAMNQPEALRTHVVKKLTAFGEGENEKELREWYARRTGDHTDLQSVPKDSAISMHWNSHFNGNQQGQVNPGMYRLLETRDRLLLEDKYGSIDRNKPAPSSPIHYLQLNDKLLHQLTDEVRRAFGKDIVINEGGGPSVWFHAGDAPTLQANEWPISPSYLRKLNALPHLSEEGDGLRSYVRILLELIPGAPFALLIDEPEAFLHPSQARRLASLLARYAENNNRQVVLATHDSAILRGALEGSKKVYFCRLTREGDMNHVHLLTIDQLQQLWSKPLLRTASAIEGVFYSGVVVCEGHADSRFYEALLQKLEGDTLFSGPTDLYFLSTGGKGELATVAAAYRALRIPVAAVADLDLLRNQSEFAKLLSTMGGQFEDIKGIYNTVLNGLGALGSRMPINDFVTQTRKLLSRVRAKQELSPTEREALSELMSGAAKWSVAKQVGITLLKGQNNVAAEQLLSYCEGYGLFLVPIGELESWWRPGPVDKNQWYYKALEALAEETSTKGSVFEEAYKFVSKIALYLGSTLRSTKNVAR